MRVAVAEAKCPVESSEALAWLAAEQHELYDLLHRLPGPGWHRSTSATGWNVSHQVAHLADTEEIAHDTIVDGPRALSREISRHATVDELTAAGCATAAWRAPGDLLAWWWRAAARTRKALAALEPAACIRWGYGMDATTLAVARLMEHWAHGVDIRRAVGITVRAHQRLAAVAWLGYVTLPYALARARIRLPPSRSLSIELVDPDINLGPTDASDRLTGKTLAWCLVSVRRSIEPGAGQLRVEGPLAELALRHAQAYL